MSVTMDLIKDDVSSVEDLGSLMLITAKSVQFKRRTETVVPRLSTWEVPRLIFSTKGKSTDSRRSSTYPFSIIVSHHVSRISITKPLDSFVIS
jgi:hypothetical protein